MLTPFQGEIIDFSLEEQTLIFPAVDGKLRIADYIEGDVDLEISSRGSRGQTADANVQSPSYFSQWNTAERNFTLRWKQTRSALISTRNRAML